MTFYKVQDSDHIMLTPAILQAGAACLKYSMGGLREPHDVTIHFCLVCECFPMHGQSRLSIITCVGKVLSENLNT